MPSASLHLSTFLGRVVCNLAITVQLFHRLRPVSLRAQGGIILSSTRRQRTLEQRLEGIRKADVSRGHALRPGILILRVHIRPSREVRPCADEDGVLTLDHIRLCVVLTDRKKGGGLVVWVEPIASLDGTDVFLLLVLAETRQERLQRLRAHKVEPLAQHGDAIPVGQDRRKPPSSRVQRLYVLLDVARVDGRRRAGRRWGWRWEGTNR